MKRLLLVFTTILSFSSFGQYLIDQYDFGSAGDTIIYGVDSAFTDDLNNIDIIGDSLYWNFSELNVFVEDTLVFQSPGDLPNGNYYAGADFGYEETVFTTFMKVDSELVSTVGMTVPLSQFIDSSVLDSTMMANIPPDILFKYNGGLHYLGLDAQAGLGASGNTEGKFTFYYGDSIMGFQADSIRLREVVDYESFIDGFGVLEIPDGEFYAIRQNVNYVRNYKIDIGFILPFIGIQWIEDVFPIPFNLNQRSYRWFTDDAKFPMVEINTDSAGTFMTSRFIIQPDAFTVDELDSISTLTLSEQTENLDFQCVKMGDGVVVQSNKTLSTIMVTDLKGSSKLIKDINQKKYHVTLPAKGVYIISVITNTSIKNKKISF